MTFTVLIPLNGHDEIRGFAAVDSTDAPAVTRHRWQITNGYAASWINGRIEYMHRVLMGRPGMQVDHANRDKLDNRRSNLRAVSDAENKQNVPARGGTSTHRGVFFSGQHQRWEARFGCPPKVRRHFDTEDEAAAFISRWRKENLAYAED